MERLQITHEPSFKDSDMSDAAVDVFDHMLKAKVRLQGVELSVSDGEFLKGECDRLKEWIESRIR